MFKLQLTVSPKAVPNSATASSLNKPATSYGPLIGHLILPETPPTARAKYSLEEIPLLDEPHASHECMNKYPSTEALQDILSEVNGWRRDYQKQYILLRSLV
uniref:Uncharacterized protein n=1 Tax=Coccidioides posadasii RMSCC 3488 TaxID=454284 RepID=A0A0J6FDL1_COCPO|nr:hypothetical protein CPAG_07488 [Coccidioides posadasii RMSCC 3488]